MKSLEKYLNEHLSGSHAALNLLQTLMRMDGPESPRYQQLHDSVGRNQKVLESLIRQAGFKRDRGTEMMAYAGSFLALLRFKSHVLRPGGLGLMEALEALHLGVQGQLLLWNNLLLPGVAVPVWEEDELAALKQSAEAQLATVEGLRLEAVKRALSGSGSGSDSGGEPVRPPSA